MAAIWSLTPAAKLNRRATNKELATSLRLTPPKLAGRAGDTFSFGGRNAIDTSGPNLRRGGIRSLGDSSFLTRAAKLGGWATHRTLVAEAQLAPSTETVGAVASSASGDKFHLDTRPKLYRRQVAWVAFGDNRPLDTARRNL